MADELLTSRPPARRYEGKKVALVFGAILIVGTIIASTAAYYGHIVGAETRVRYEAARHEAGRHEAGRHEAGRAAERH